MLSKLKSIIKLVYSNIIVNNIIKGSNKWFVMDSQSSSLTFIKIVLKFTPQNTF